MQTTLLQGQYNSIEAEQLVSQLCKVNTDFYIANIDTQYSSEEDIKHAEKKVKQLEDEWRKLKLLLQKANQNKVALRTNLTLELVTNE